MQAVIQITHIVSSHSDTNPPPSTIQCAMVSGDMPLVQDPTSGAAVVFYVPKANVGQFSVGQQLTISG